MSVAALSVSEINGLNLEKMKGRAFFPHRQKTVRIITRCPYYVGVRKAGSKF